MTKERFALIAGAGDLPLVLARAARDEGASFVAIALSEAAQASLDGLADSVYRFSIGQVGKIIRTIRREGIDRAVFIGKVRKDLLFEKIRFDFKALNILASLKDRNDDTIMLAIVRELAVNGIQVLDQTVYLRDLMPHEGVLTRREPTPDEWKDVSYGIDMARKVAGLDIGQTIVVKDRAVMAVEAIEGTDEAVIRGGLLARKGAVVAKVAKPDQDMRFDVPTAGLATIHSMARGGAGVLAIEAGRVVLVDMERVVSEAEDAGMSIVSYKMEESV